MLKLKNRNRVFASMHCQKGMALLILLSLILIAVTAVAVSHLSLNAQSINREKITIQALSYSKNVILGYALSQSIPGSLPCPDSNGDGLSDTTGCTNRRGLLPYKTLGIAMQYDGSGQPLWYVTDANYAGVISPPHNSSRPTSLTIDSGNLMAFIVIAPNKPLSNQIPSLQPLANVTQFLEGDNSDNTLNSYSNLKDNTHNDVLMGVTTADFWILIEKMVLDEAIKLINDYEAACNQYPWAANFNDTNANSVSNQLQGAFPLGDAQPTIWGQACSNGNAPSPSNWLINNWKQQLFYARCPSATGCLSFVGNSITAKAIVIAPGVPIGSQSRPPFVINNLFEGEDVTPNNIFDYTSGANDNDLLKFIE